MSNNGESKCRRHLFFHAFTESELARSMPKVIYLNVSDEGLDQFDEAITKEALREVTWDASRSTKIAVPYVSIAELERMIYRKGVQSVAELICNELIEVGTAIYDHRQDKEIDSQDDGSDK